MSDKYIGIKFLGYDFYLCEVIKHYKDNMYLVKDSERSRDNGVYCAIMTNEDIDKMLSIQNDLQEDYTASLKRQLKEKEKQEILLKEKQEKENLYGFTNNKTDLQKGKILKCLMTTLCYNNEVITRKQFVINVLKEGYVPDIKTYTNWKTGKSKKSYVLNKDSEFYELTKTEYDFASYLLDTYSN